MTDDENDIWEYDNLDVDDDGFVEGSAYTRQFGDGLDVQVGVTSYEYDRNGETRMNHVPNVVVTDADGSIVAEPHANDSSDARTAIKNGKGAAEMVVERPDQFQLDG